MINLKTFFTGPLNDIKNSFEEKQKFSETHIGKLIAKNIAHQYDAMIADTTTAHTAFFGGFTDVNVKLGIQKTQTAIVDDLILNFTSGCTRLNKYFGFTGLDKTPLYSTFFKNGVQEFTNQTNKGNVKDHIDRMVAAITAHTTEAGGASVLTQFTAYQTDYATARALQLVEIGQVESGRTTRDDAEAIWNDQIYDNILVLAREFKNKPDMMDDFFDQSILRTDNDSSKDGKGLITGVVVDEETGEAIGEVTVHVIDGKIDNAHTKLPDARYRTQLLSVDTYNVIFSKKKYVSKTQSVEIKDDGETIADIKLKKEA